MAEQGFEAGFNTGEQTPLQQLERFLAARGVGQAQQTVQPSNAGVQNVQPVQQGPETATVVPTVDFNNKSVTVHSLGHPRTQAEFQDAIDTYNKSKGKEKPKGFLIVAQDNPSFFEGMHQISSAIRNLPEGYGVPSTVKNIAADVVPDTPAKLGTDIGIGIAAPWLKPTVGVARPLLTGLANAAKVGASGTFGAETGRFASEGTTQFRSPGEVLARTASEFGVIGAAQGTVGLFSHWIGKYLAPDTANKVTTDILNEVKKQFPNLASDPTLLPAALSSADKIKSLTQIGNKALLSDFNTAANDLVTNMQQAMGKTTLSATNGPTLRAQLRQLTSKAEELVLSTGTQQERDAIIANMRNVATAIQNTVATEFTTRYGQVAAANKAPVVLNVLRQFQGSLSKLQEGTQVLAAFRQADVHEGFNFVKLSDAITGNYRENPGSLLDRIGGILAGGQGRVLPPPSGIAQKQIDPAEQMVRDGLIKLFPPLKYLLSGSGQKNVSTVMPWQTGTQPSVKGQAVPTAVAVPVIKEYLKQK